MENTTEFEEMFKIGFGLFLGITILSFLPLPIGSVSLTLIICTTLLIYYMNDLKLEIKNLHNN